MSSTPLGARRRSVFRCTECGGDAPKWVGRCPSCGEWNTLVEEVDEPSRPVVLTPTSAAQRITEVDTEGGVPWPTGVAEVDRVLGGGLIAGSVTLIGGEPGVGKSTLLLQVLARPAIGGRSVLYVTAEESASQVRRRAERLGALNDSLYLAAETDLDQVMAHIAEVDPAVIVIDSIQTVADPALSSAPGSVAQVRQCASRLVQVAKSSGRAIVLVGHVTKDGGLAGPRVLEHVVDTVLSFDGDRHHSLRFLRATKHRFGSTQELGVLTMGERGLDAVGDPSDAFLADRYPDASGSTVVPTLEGRRPLLVEIQALVSDSSLPQPRRSAQGLDSGRVGMISAVISRRAELPLGQKDIFTAAVGGARVHEPGADLAVAVAIASSLHDVAVPPDVVMCGEIGLAGELRSVAGIERRLAEAARLGFHRAMVPTSTPDVDAPISLLRVPTLPAGLALFGLVGGR